jgi:hypothetical protein
MDGTTSSTDGHRCGSRAALAARRALFGLVGLLAAGTWTSSARADGGVDTTLAADLDAAVPVNQDFVSSGYGFGLRLGRRLDAKVVYLAGEIGASYYSLGDVLQPRIYRGLVGARLGFGSIVRPVIFGHVGVARINFAEPPGIDLDRTGLAWDAGLGLDFTLLPLINLGVHGAYNSIGPHANANAFTWATVGANIELVF